MFDEIRIVKSYRQCDKALINPGQTYSGQLKMGEPVEHRKMLLYFKVYTLICRWIFLFSYFIEHNCNL